MERDSKYYVKLFEKARDFEPNRADEQKTLVAFYEGTYKLLASYDENKPWVIDINAPYASDAIDIRVASLQSSDYVGELEPLSPNDEKDITLLNNILKNFWNEMDVDMVINNSIRNAAIIREAYAHVVYDDTKIEGGTNTLRKGALEVYLIDASSVLIDPNALKLDEADYLIVIERITRQQAKDNGFISSLDEHLDGSSSPSERGEIFEGNDYDTNQENILTKWTVYEKREKKIFKTILVNKKIVEKTEEFFLDVYPIAQLHWQRKFKSPYGLSLMDRLLDLQKSINAIKSASTNAALQFAAPSFIVNETSGLDPKKLASVIGVPGLVVKARGDINNAIKQMFDSTIDPQLIGIAVKDEETIYKLAGASPEFMGNFGSAGNTKGGSDNSVNRAKIIEQNFLTNLQDYVEKLTRIIVKYITIVFADKSIYARGEKSSKGKYKFNKYVVPPKLKDLDYTYSVHLDVKTPYAKEKTKALLLELFQIENQYNSPVKVLNILDIFKVYDLPNKQELIERFEDLTSKDDEAKAEMITQWTNLCFNHNIDPTMVSQGIFEILGGEELPTIDKVTAEIEQQMAMEEQQEEAQQESEMVQQMLAQQAQQEQAPQLTGDEEFSVEQEQEPQLTGDEEFGIDS